MISAARQQLHRLWWQPGAVMEAGWWHFTRLLEWQASYFQYTQLQPVLNTLINRRLGHTGQCPQLSPVAERLLDNPAYCTVLCIALGLWQAQCQDYLLLRPYRNALLQYMDEVTLGQLDLLLPYSTASEACVGPNDLPSWAICYGAAWLRGTEDRAIALCALLYPPGMNSTTAEPVMPVLAKLMRWL